MNNLLYMYDSHSASDNKSCKLSVIINCFFLSLIVLIRVNMLYDNAAHTVYHDLQHLYCTVL